MKRASARNIATSLVVFASVTTFETGLLMENIAEHDLQVMQKENEAYESDIDRITAKKTELKAATQTDESKIKLAESTARQSALGSTMLNELLGYNRCTMDEVTEFQDCLAQSERIEEAARPALILAGQAIVQEELDTLEDQIRDKEFAIGANERQLGGGDETEHRATGTLLQIIGIMGMGAALYACRKNF